MITYEILIPAYVILSYVLNTILFQIANWLNGIDRDNLSDDDYLIITMIIALSPLTIWVVAVMVLYMLIVPRRSNHEK